MSKFSSICCDIGFRRSIGQLDRAFVGLSLTGAWLCALSFILTGQTFAFFWFFVFLWLAYRCWESPIVERWPGSDGRKAVIVGGRS